MTGPGFAEPPAQEALLMSRRIRWYHPQVRYYEVTLKCAGDEMLMRPDPHAVFLIARAIAMACGKYEGIFIHAICCVSNHIHILIAINPGAPIALFMQLMNSQIGRPLNALRDRSGHFFKGPYKPTPILTDAHLFSRMTYVHAQPVHHDLVAHAEEWPGLSSFRAVCDGKPSIDVSYFDEAAWKLAGAHAAERDDYTETASIPITPLPHWDALNEHELRAARRAHEESLRDREREKQAERNARREHRPLPQPSSYERTDPFSRPAGGTKRGRRPWAHGDEQAIEEYREAYSRMLESYAVASERFRATGVLCEFPEGTFPPRLLLLLPLAVT